MFPPSQLFRERYFGNHLSEKEKSSGQWLTSYPLFLRGSGNPIEQIVTNNEITCLANGYQTLLVYMARY